MTVKIKKIYYISKKFDQIYMVYSLYTKGQDFMDILYSIVFCLYKKS